jgi:4-hydroxybenzoate polyprenyltransferase
MTTAAPHAIARPSRLQLYLRLGRVSNLPTVWTNTGAGMLLALASAGGTASRALPRAMGVLACAFSLFYVGGMFLNDAFDRRIDARERPERPIPAGQIAAAEVFGVGFALLLGGVALVAIHAFALGGAGGLRAVAASVLLGAAIVLYDVWHKGNPASPLLMAACRVLVYLTAGLAATGTLDAPLLVGAAMLLCYLVGLTYVAKQENLARVRNLWPLVLLFAPLAVTLPGLRESAVAAALWIALAAWVSYAVARLKKRSRGVIPKVVVGLIAGISVLDALLVASAGHGSGTGGVGGAAAVALAAGFPLTLFLQRYVKGT